MEAPQLSTMTHILLPESGQDMAETIGQAAVDGAMDFDRLHLVGVNPDDFKLMVGALAFHVEHDEAGQSAWVREKVEAGRFDLFHPAGKTTIASGDEQRGVARIIERRRG